MDNDVKIAIDAVNDRIYRCEKEIEDLKINSKETNKNIIKTNESVLLLSGKLDNYSDKFSSYSETVQQYMKQQKEKEEMWEKRLHVIEEKPILEKAKSFDKVKDFITSKILLGLLALIILGFGAYIGTLITK